MPTAAKKRTASKPSSSSSSTPKPAPYSDWPKKGDTRNQPWDHKPDETAPVAITHQRPMLTSGSADPAVLELCRQLGILGYETSASKGENAFGIVDASVLGAVQQFRRDYGVQEDPSGFLDDATANNHIGPWTWEAVQRAAEREK